MHEAFTRDSITALIDMKTSGSGYELGDVRAYFAELVSHRKGLQAKPRDLVPTHMGLLSFPRSCVGMRLEQSLMPERLGRHSHAGAWER